MTWTIYDPTTGITTSRVRNQNQIVGRPHVPGSYQPGQWFVKLGQIRRLPDPPASLDHVVWIWNLEQESWSVDAARTEWAARDARERLLIDVDRVNPMWWQAMTVEQQTETAAYRQAILDLPGQPGWPESIDWPPKPAWL